MVLMRNIKDDHIPQWWVITKGRKIKYMNKLFFYANYTMMESVVVEEKYEDDDNIPSTVATVDTAIENKLESVRSRLTRSGKSIKFLDIPFGSVDSEVTKEEREFLKRVMEIAGSAKSHHSQKIGKLKSFNKFLNIASQVLSILAGSTGIGTLINAPRDMDGRAYTSLVIITVLSLFSAIVGTLHSGLALEGKAVSHKQTSVEYGNILTKIAHFLATPGSSRKEIEVFTNDIVIELGVIESGAEIG